MTEEKKPKKVRFVYHKLEDYKVYPVNGLYGGVSSRGEFIGHFFLEHHEIPKEEIQSIKEDGSLGEVEAKPSVEVKIDRDLQVGIMVNCEQAVNIANWILDRVKQFEKVKTEHKK
jgi:hypothetical protein